MNSPGVAVSANVRWTFKQATGCRRPRRASKTGRLAQQGRSSLLSSSRKNDAEHVLCIISTKNPTTLIENSELWENPQVYIFFKKKKCCFFHISQNMMREIAFLGGNVHKTTIQIAVL